VKTALIFHAHGVEEKGTVGFFEENSSAVSLFFAGMARMYLSFDPPVGYEPHGRDEYI